MRVRTFPDFAALAAAMAFLPATAQVERSPEHCVVGDYILSIEYEHIDYDGSSLTAVGDHPCGSSRGLDSQPYAILRATQSRRQGVAGRASRRCWSLPCHRDRVPSAVARSVVTMTAATPFA